MIIRLWRVVIKIIVLVAWVVFVDVVVFVVGVMLVHVMVDCPVVSNVSEMLVKLLHRKVSVSGHLVWME